MECEEKSVLLSDVANGKKVKVCKVNAGVEAKRRLANLGLVPGVEISKKQSAPLHGPVEIEVRGSILALGRGIATKIHVVQGRD